MSFVGPSYTLQHRKADVQRAVNLMVAPDEAGGGKSAAYLDSVPGLTTFSAFPVLLLETGAFILYENDGYVLLE